MVSPGDIAGNTEEEEEETYPASSVPEDRMWLPIRLLKSQMQKSHQFSDTQHSSLGMKKKMRHHRLLFCFQTNNTFLTVEQKQEDGSWKVMFTDADWETRLVCWREEQNKFC